MRRQIGFEIRDMWYNLGNSISSVFQYCLVLIVTNTVLLNEFSDIGMLEIDMCRCCDKRCFLIFIIISQLSTLALIIRRHSGAAKYRQSSVNWLYLVR